MNNAVVITVSGVPKAQPRARAHIRRIGTACVAGFYTPASANAWKRLIGYNAAQHRTSVSGLLKATGGVTLTVQFRLPRPKSHCTRAGGLKPNAPRVHVTKPDLDNLAKAVMDALVQCGVLPDDRLVVGLELSKEYAASASSTGCTIVIKAAEPKQCCQP